MQAKHLLSSTCEKQILRFAQNDISLLAFGFEAFPGNRLPVR